jgi:8-oxo-dGTP diphosphatase
MKDNFERFMVSQAAILTRNNKCLILQFADNKKWGLPGGRIDKGETGKSALQREIKEELGIDKFEYLGVTDYDFYYYQREGETIAKLNIINLIRSDVDELIINSDEHSDSRWITMNEMGDYEFVWPNMERIIKNSFEYKKLLEK